MFRNLLRFVKALFGVASETTEYQLAKNNKYNNDYKDIRNVNFTSIFANKFATQATLESEVIVTDDYDTPSKRTDMLNDIIKRSYGKYGKKYITRALGVGGIVLVPFVANGKVYVNLVSQDRFSINEKIGDDIVNATILSEVKEIENKKYYRWTNYILEDNKDYRIVTFATTDSDTVPLATVPAWANIVPEIVIPNCDRMLFAFIKCPRDNRNDDDSYGVPITYGCDKTIAEIYECLRQIEVEFDAKRVQVMADSRLFGKDNRLSLDGLFQKFDGGGEDNFWEVFDPALRESSYYNRLKELYSSLEQQVGSSKGILTEQTSQYATATEVIRGNGDTYSIVDDIRREVEKGIEDLIYACNVLIDCYNLAPHSDYRVVFNWSYALIENSTETWQQLYEAQSIGAVSKAEVRQYLMSNESLEESKKMIEEIREEDAEADAERNPNVNVDTDGQEVIDEKDDKEEPKKDEE